MRSADPALAEAPPASGPVRTPVPTAFETVVVDLTPMVLATCRRVLGNPADAEDAAQNVFLILHQSWPRLRQHSGSVAAWTHRTALNVARNAARIRQRRQQHEEWARSAMPTGCHPDEVDADPGLLLHLDAAVQDLPAPLREAVVLHYLRGMSVSASAAAAGCQPNTFSQRLVRAVERLRVLLARRGVSGPAGLLAIMPPPACPGLTTAILAQAGDPTCTPPRVHALARELLRLRRNDLMRLTCLTALATVALGLLPMLSLPGGDAANPAGSVQPPYSWRGIDGSGMFPAKDLVTEWWDLPADLDPKEVAKLNLGPQAVPGSQHHIVWRTTLPHWGNNTPVAVKDFVFVLCDEGWKHEAPQIVCLSAKDGRILWQAGVDHLDAWPAEKAKVGRELRAKNQDLWRRYMVWWNRLYWDNDKGTWKENASQMKSAKEAPPVSPEQEALVKQARAEGWNFDPIWMRGVSGGSRGRFFANSHAEGRKIHEECVKNRYYFRQGWTSEAPWYGSTMGSVVSDGTRVYAVTAMGGAAAFTLDGKRQWVADLEGIPDGSGPNCHMNPVHFNMAAPVLADGRLVYYHRDNGVMYGLDAATGRIAFKTEAPRRTPKPGEKKAMYGSATPPLGGAGHFAPGGTPVVLRLGAKGGGAPVTVVVSSNGLVVRVSDGRNLGYVRTPVEKGKELTFTDDREVTSVYFSAVGQGDILFHPGNGGHYGSRLTVDGDAMKQEILWANAAAKVDIHYAPNLIAHAGNVLVTVQGKGGGLRWLNGLTGEDLGMKGLAGGLSLGAAEGRLYTRDAVLDLKDLRSLGRGAVRPPKPVGEIRERHIAFLGFTDFGAHYSGVACWGNRIFFRDHDYLWCIGDPEKPWLPPEAVLPGGK